MPMDNETQDAVVDNLGSMGYGARRYEITDDDGRKIQRIYLETGSKNIKAYLDCSGNDPGFFVKADFPEGHEKGTLSGEKIALYGDELAKHNSKQAWRVRGDLTGAVITALVAATGGADIDALKKGFLLQNNHDPYKPAKDRGAASQLEQSTAPMNSPKTPGTVV